MWFAQALAEPIRPAAAGPGVDVCLVKAWGGPSKMPSRMVALIMVIGGDISYLIYW